MASKELESGMLSDNISSLTPLQKEISDSEGCPEISCGLSRISDYYLKNKESFKRIDEEALVKHFVFSTKINNSFSLGFKIDRLFGNQFHTKKTFISSFDSFAESEFQYSQQDSTYKIVFNEFSGYKIQMDWLIDLSEPQIAFSAASMIKAKAILRFFA